MIKRLEKVHEERIIHRDIKPDNFLLGLNDARARVYAIDFGFCKKLSALAEPAKTNSLVGSPNYASVNAHDLCELSHRDDLESLGYMLIYLHAGRLPWQDCGDHRAIKAAKLCALDDSRLPAVLTEYIRHVRALEFNEAPNYGFLSAAWAL